MSEYDLKVLQEVLDVLRRMNYKILAAKVEAVLAHNLPTEDEKSD